jgi:NifU-like protein involved in Fe-S cluster formation
MDDIPHACCCGPARHVSVADLFERGFRRNRAAPLPLAGARCADQGLVASFSLDLTAGRLAAIGFHASSCVTLLAYCEYLVETLIGQSPQAAQAISPADIVAALPGVPALKRDRARLAVAALRAALAEISDFVPATREDAAP